ncbi:hypothetical protein BGX24_002413 [Mortierella sp. AD032]|nr:hypothetical protein BGX24_002413 [Mortierella sp. AD032]
MAAVKRADFIDVSGTVAVYKDPYWEVTLEFLDVFCIFQSFDGFFLLTYPDTIGGENVAKADDFRSAVKVSTEAHYSRRINGQQQSDDL